MGTHYPHRQAGGSTDRTEAHSSASGGSARPFARALHMSFRAAISRPSLPELGGDHVTACWEGRIDDQFLTGVAPFGGYVVGVAMQAARLEVTRLGIDGRFPEPVSLSATLLEAGRSDAYLALVTPVRIGGRFAVFDVAIRQSPLSLPKPGLASGSAPWITLLTAKITMSDLASERGTTTILSDDGKTPITDPFLPSALRSPSGSLTVGVGLSLPRLADTMPVESKTVWKDHYHSPRTGKMFREFFDVRHQKYEEGELGDLPIGAEWCKWVRWNSGDVQSIPSMAFWGDTPINPIIIHQFFGPQMHSGVRQWSPTMDFALQIRHIPPPSTEWVLLRSKVPYATNGRKCLDIEVWDDGGTLLAVARQMQGTVIVSPARDARTVEANAAGRQSLETKQSSSGSEGGGGVKSSGPRAKI